MRWNAFLRAAVLVAALLCLCPRGAAAAEAAQKLELTKGLNFVALPAAPLSADLTDVLRPILDQVEMVQFYEPKTGSWRFFAPALNGDNTLADLREGAAFYVRVIETSRKKSSILVGIRTRTSRRNESRR